MLSLTDTIRKNIEIAQNSLSAYLESDVKNKEKIQTIVNASLRSASNELTQLYIQEISASLPDYHDLTKSYDSTKALAISLFKREEEDLEEFHSSMQNVQAAREILEELKSLSQSHPTDSSLKEGFFQIKNLYRQVQGKLSEFLIKGVREEDSRFSSLMKHCEEIKEECLILENYINSIQIPKNFVRNPNLGLPSRNEILNVKKIDLKDPKIQNEIQILTTGFNQYGNFVGGILGASQIFPNLLLGGADSELEARESGYLGLAATAFKGNKEQICETFFSFPLEDTDVGAQSFIREDFKALKEAILLLAQNLEEQTQLPKERQKPIFIYCQQGKDRSALAILAFIMKYYDVTREQALQYLLAKRLIVTTQDIPKYWDILSTENFGNRELYPPFELR